jgi:hypothetical protein
MALIRCPECQREVSDKAFTCPGCGHPLWQAGLRPGAIMAGMRGAASANSYEYKSQRTVFGMPLIHIVYGPAWLTGFKPARGFIAIGNVAIGVIAMGGFAVGLVTIAGIGLGALCLGGIALGLGVGVGGIATGYLAIGGLAIGVYAIGGMGIGAHTLANDPNIMHWFRNLFPR